MNKDEVFELAKIAIEAMLKERGPEYKFPFDEVWQYTPGEVVIPSTQRPHQAKRLVNEGLIEATGDLTKAKSQERAGSPTREYRFGPNLVERPVHPPVRESGGVADIAEMLKLMQEVMDSEGYITTPAELANFYLAMMVSPLVILSGISGTGKSLLPRQFSKHTDSSFYSIPVQPQWSDNTDLFGYVPTLTPDQFVAGHLIESLMEAKSKPDKLVLALLDEMNLAPVEHYFSDFLSVIETRQRVDAKIETDVLPIELPRVVEGQEDSCSELRKLGLPHNLRVVGTANMDETTHTFSPKVLDRAFTIEFDDPDLTTFSSASKGRALSLNKLASIIIDEGNEISVREAQRNQELFDEVTQLLVELQDILTPAGIKFGYRTRDAILMYLHFWSELEISDVLPADAALDFCILQKVLPKVSGSGDSLLDSLHKLSEWLGLDRSVEGKLGAEQQTFTGPFNRSLQKVNRMTAMLEVDGATHYWGT